MKFINKSSGDGKNSSLSGHLFSFLCSPHFSEQGKFSEGCVRPLSQMERWPGSKGGPGSGWTMVLLQGARMGEGHTLAGGARAG